MLFIVMVWISERPAVRMVGRSVAWTNGSLAGVPAPLGQVVVDRFSDHRTHVALEAFELLLQRELPQCGRLVLVELKRMASDPSLIHPNDRSNGRLIVRTGESLVGRTGNGGAPSSFG